MYSNWKQSGMVTLLTDYWGTPSDATLISGTILSFDVIYNCAIKK